jgi:hypothetical protein
MKFSHTKQHTKKTQKTERELARQERKQLRIAAANGDWEAAKKLKEEAQ